MKVHGSFTLEVNKKTVTFTAYDAWNYEAAVNWGNEFKTIIAQFNNEPWVCIVDLTQWELATPDTRVYISEFYQWVNDHNLKYLAVIFGHSLQKSVLEKTYTILTNVERQYFLDKDEAGNWLKSLGF